MWKLFKVTQPVGGKYREYYKGNEGIERSKKIYEKLLTSTLVVIGKLTFQNKPWVKSLLCSEKNHKGPFNICKYTPITSSVFGRVRSGDVLANVKRSGCLFNSYPRTSMP